MSIELHVLLPQVAPPQIAVWQAGAIQKGINITFDATFDPATSTGWVAIGLNDWRAGFEYEFGRETVSGLIEMYPSLHELADEMRAIATFTWAGDPLESRAGLAAAASLAATYGGLVYDPQGDDVYSGAEAIEMAKRELDSR